MNVHENTEPNRKRPRKGSNPSRFKPVESTSRSVKTLETETKREGGKRVEADSNVWLQNKNTSGEKLNDNSPITPQINERQEKANTTTSSCGLGLEHCVKTIRELECSGHLKSNFRMKFLTWFSLRATAEETKIVRTFIHAFKDDSVALAEQLVDAFSDCISIKHSANGDGTGSSSSSSSSSSGAFCKKKPRL